MLLSLLLIDALPLLQQVGEILVLILSHPGHTVTIDDVILTVGLQVLDPFLLLFSPELLGLLLELLVLGLEKRQLLEPLGSLDVVLLLLLGLQTNLQLLLLLLKLFNLLSHDVVGIHLGNCVLVQLAEHFLANVGLGKLLDLVLVVLGLDGLELLLAPLFVPDLPLHSQPLGLLLLLLQQLVPLLLLRLLHLGRVDRLQPLLSLLNDLVPGQETLVIPDLALVVSLSDLCFQLCRLDLQPVRVDGVQRLVEHIEHVDQLRTHLLARHGLHMGTLGHLCLLRLGEIGSEVDAGGAVVDPHLHVVVPRALNNQPLHVVAIAEDGQGDESVHRDALVDLGHLFQQSDQGHVPERLSVLLDRSEVLLLFNHFQTLINFAANTERMEVNLKPVVKVTELL